jgi:hypothetical protein
MALLSKFGHAISSILLCGCAQCRIEWGRRSGKV